MNMNCLPIKDQRKWDIQSIIKMWLVAKRNNITLRSEYASQNLVENLKKENTKQRIALNNLANGIYSYEVLFANKLRSIGKITIIN
jgi:hypothetical protein